MASSAITGFISLQIYPLLFQDIKLDSLNVLNFNLSIPSLIVQKPFEVENFEDENKNGLILKVIPEKSNVWTKLKIKGSMTIKQFEQYLFDKYGVELEGIYTLDEKPIINKNYECKLEEAYFRAKSEDIQNKFNNVIYFSVYGCGKDFDIVKMPIFEYQF